MADDPRARDDNLMDRFDEEGLTRFSSRQAVIAVLITSLLLILFSGASVRHAGDEMKPGIGRDLVLAFGKPAGWLADRLPLSDAAADVTSVVSAKGDVGTEGSFGAQVSAAQNEAGKVPPITAGNFDPNELGEAPAQRKPLAQLLVTGDSLSTPLDIEIARRLAPDGIRITEDPHLASGISNPSIVDWGALATSQVTSSQYEAVVVFIGANEGYPMPGPGGKDVSCCGPEWAAIFANRARQMMDTYRADGRQVYWLLVPTPRDPDRQRIERTVNDAIEVAAQPWRDQVHVFDTVDVFTPGDKYRDSMPVDESDKIVRESDGIHLNDTGARLAADLVIDQIEKQFTLGN